MALTQVPQSLIVQPVVTYGPAFAVSLGTTQAVAASTYTKLNLNTAIFDTNGCFDLAAYRFTPTTPGYYQLTGKMSTNSSTNAGIDILAVYKNGAIYVAGPSNYSTTTNGLAANVDCLVYLNGTTDYVELFGYVGGSGSNSVLGGSNTTFFMGFLARPA